MLQNRKNIKYTEQRKYTEHCEEKGQTTHNGRLIRIIAGILVQSCKQEELRLMSLEFIKQTNTQHSLNLSIKTIVIIENGIK